jgi:hypothetical protein
VIYTHAAAAAVALAVGFAGGWRVHDWKAEAARAAELDLQAREQARDAIRVDTAANDYETQRAAGQQRQRVITRTVERIVREPFYAPGAASCLDPDGLRILAAAVGGTDPAGQPAPAVPAASAASR